MKRFWSVIGLIALPCHAVPPVNSVVEPWFNVSREHEKAQATEPLGAYYGDKGRGWFWYEREPEPEFLEEFLPEPMQPPQPAQKTPVELVPLSSEWFRKNLEKYRDKAVDEPTDANVAAYLYLQRVALDKASRFSDVAQRVVMSDPVLDENSRRPIATFGAFAKDDMANRGKEKAAKMLAKMAGLWFIYESTCVFCVKQAGVLKGLQNAYGFEVLAVSQDGLPLPGNTYPDFVPDQGQSKKLGVDMTPALFLVRPGKDGGVIQIAQGLVAGDEIIRRAITLAHQQGWLGEQEYEVTKHARSISVDTDIGQTLDAETLNDPAALTQTIKANLKKQLKTN